MTARTVCYILFFILWQIELCGIIFFSFYDSSNGVLYFVFHLIIFRTVCYILFFIYDSSNCVLYFDFHLITVRTVIKWKTNIPHRSNCHQMKNKIYHTVRTVIKWKTKYKTPFEQSYNEKVQKDKYIQNMHIKLKIE